MADYIKLVQSLAELNEFKSSNNFITPNVTAIYGDTIVDYNPYIPPNYFKFTAEEDNCWFRLDATYNYNTFEGPPYSPKIEYSLNGGEWTQWDYDLITLNTGDTICMKGNNSNCFNKNSSYYYYFITNGKIGASGNIMSLLYDDDFERKLTIPCEYCFTSLFRGCRSLTTTPELPATTLTNGCYKNMFSSCTSLTTAPELPATTLASNCYDSMFWNCTSLTTAPELPATTLVSNCYNYMFNNCTKLNYIKMLATDISAMDCLFSWVYGVSSTGIFVKHPNLTSYSTGDHGIPSGWTVQDA